ncbi:MAG: transposase [Acidobacteriota bacterium]
MGRPLLYVPPSGGLFLVTTRTVHGRFLLRPGMQLNALAAGVLGRAQRRHEVEIHAAVVLSNHYHLLISVRDAEQLASFMCFFNGNLARKAGRLYDWKERFWGRRYRATLVSEEPEAQIDRLRYVLAQGCKEGLVGSPLDWPGLTCAPALLEGQDLQGVWDNRTRRFLALKANKQLDDTEFQEQESVVFSPLPCWQDLEPVAYQNRIRNLVQGITEETVEMHAERGTQPLGAENIRRQQPHSHPNRPARSPAPRFHGIAKAVLRAILEAYREFVEAYRAAAEQLRRGEQGVSFPEGCFPPRLPFVPPLRPG